MSKPKLPETQAPKTKDKYRVTNWPEYDRTLVLRPAIFKVIRPSLFEVSQWILSRAFTGITHTEDSARQPAGFQAIFFLRQGCKGSQKLISCCF